MRGLRRRGKDDVIEEDVRRRGEREGENEGENDGREGQGSAEGYLFCLAALLNTELPLPKETEHKT